MQKYELILDKQVRLGESYQQGIVTGFVAGRRGQGLSV